MACAASLTQQRVSLRKSFTASRVAPQRTLRVVAAAQRQEQKVIGETMGQGSSLATGGTTASANIAALGCC